MTLIQCKSTSSWISAKQDDKYLSDTCLLYTVRTFSIVLHVMTSLRFHFSFIFKYTKLAMLVLKAPAVGSKDRTWNLSILV